MRRLFPPLCLAGAVGIFAGALAAGAFMLGLVVGEDMGKAGQGCSVDVREGHGPDRLFFDQNGDGNRSQRPFPSRASTPT